jgi:hypothetical protein
LFVVGSDLEQRIVVTESKSDALDSVIPVLSGMAWVTMRGSRDGHEAWQIDNNRSTAVLQQTATKRKLSLSDQALASLTATTLSTVQPSAKARVISVISATPTPPSGPGCSADLSFVEVLLDKQWVAFDIGNNL